MQSYGIGVKTSSSYNSQSQGLIERMVSIFREQLKKRKQTGLSQLQIDKLVFELNARESDNGSAVGRFPRRGLRRRLPNSWDRNVDAKDVIKQGREEWERRVRKKSVLMKLN